MYGLGTRSYNRSTEARQNKLAQKEATAKFLEGPRVEVIVGPICSCRSFKFPHEIARHHELQGDWDWRLETERRGVERWEERIR